MTDEKAKPPLELKRREYEELPGVPVDDWLAGRRKRFATTKEGEVLIRLSESGSTAKQYTNGAWKEITLAEAFALLRAKVEPPATPATG